MAYHVFLFSEKAENKNRKKLKRIGKSYIFKVESKYFVSGRSRPLRVQCTNLIMRTSGSVINRMKNNKGKSTYLVLCLFWAFYSRR